MCKINFRKRKTCTNVEDHVSEDTHALISTHIRENKGQLKLLSRHKDRPKLVVAQIDQWLLLK